MNFKSLLVFSSVLVLAACFPSKEITEENAESILGAGNRINQVSDMTEQGLDDAEGARISNSSLERYLLRAARNIGGACENDQGTYALSISENESDFTILFDDCEGDDGGTVDGTFSGNISETGDTLTATMVGDLEASKGNESITFDPINFILAITYSNTDVSVATSHSGTYIYDTSAYKGKVTVETVTPVSYSLSTSEWAGEVTYTDESGNVLRVEHDNNGVHLYYNNNLLNTYSHLQWQYKFG
jgi:hypothetical protein